MKIHKPKQNKNIETQGQGSNGNQSDQKAKAKTAIGKPPISIITLNVNGQNSTIKRHRFAEWIKKQNPTICCLQETHLSSKDTYRLKVENDISKKWHSEKSRSSGTNVGRNRLQDKKGKGRY